MARPLRSGRGQGEFPWQNLRQDGYAGTSPVGAFPPNGYGLCDMTGNVWEWTVTDWVSPAGAGSACCGPGLTGQPARLDQAAASDRPAGVGDEPTAAAVRVIKGGSHLCAPNYCHRYRPAARQGEPVDTSTSHLGFRCVLRPEP